MRTRRPFIHGFLVLPLTLGAAAGCGAVARAAETIRPAVLFESPDLRIYRVVGRLGQDTLVLTNLDEEGNLLNPGAEPRDCGEVGPSREASVPAEAAAPPAPVRPASGSVAVRIVVNGAADGGSAFPASDPEPRDEAEGAPAVVVNVNVAQAPPPAQPASPWGYPAIVLEGLPGPFRYPKRQYFLGYGPDISSPSLFGGLGLNAGNRFGLTTGGVCGPGYDCLFLPRPQGH